MFAAFAGTLTNLLCKEYTVHLFFVFYEYFGGIFNHFSSGSSLFSPTKQKYKSEIDE